VAYRNDNPELKRAFLKTSQAHGVEGEWRERDADNREFRLHRLSRAKLLI